MAASPSSERGESSSVVAAPLLVLPAAARFGQAAQEQRGGGGLLFLRPCARGTVLSSFHFILHHRALLFERQLSSRVPAGRPLLPTDDGGWRYFPPFARESRARRLLLVARSPCCSSLPCVYVSHPSPGPVVLRSIFFSAFSLCARFALPPPPLRRRRSSSSHGGGLPFYVLANKSRRAAGRWPLPALSSSVIRVSSPPPRRGLPRPSPPLLSSFSSPLGPQREQSKVISGQQPPPVQEDSSEQVLPRNGGVRRASAEGLIVLSGARRRQSLKEDERPSERSER